MDTTMAEKIQAILGSVRFWTITLTAVLAILNGQSIVETAQIWLAAIAAIGTLDSVARKIGGKE